MTAYIIRRLLAMIPILLGITFLSFALINLIPGSPVMTLRDNPKIRPGDLLKLEQQLGLDKPWPERYVTWLGDLARGDLGVSLYNRLPVADRIWAVIPNTLLLAVSSLIFALIIAVPFGVYAAVKHRSWFDHTVNVGSVAMFAIPDVWLCLVLVWVFALTAKQLGLPSLPVGGMTNPRGGGDLLDRVQHMILPVIALSLAQIGGWALIIRSSMLEVISNDFVRTAQAKGLADRIVYYVHALKPAFITLLTLIGLALPGLIGGAIIIETIFAWPGMGRLTFEAIGRRDYTMIMATTLMFAVLTMISNLFTDVAYVSLDPRIRLD